MGHEAQELGVLQAGFRPQEPQHWVNILMVISPKQSSAECIDPACIYSLPPLLHPTNSFPLSTRESTELSRALPFLTPLQAHGNQPSSTPSPLRVLPLP